MTPETDQLTHGTPASQLDTPAARLAALQAAIGDSVVAIQSAAHILRRMEDAGDDLGGIPAHLLGILRRINSNLMLPEVAVQLSGTLRAKVALLPISTQREVMRPDYTVDVALLNGDTVAIRPTRLTPEQVRQVFGDGYIRQRAEQMAAMSKPRDRKQRGRPPGSKTVEVDAAKQVVTYHGHTITKQQLLRWLSEL